MSPVAPTLLKIDTHRSGLSFAKRIYPPRIVGLGGGFFCVAGVFISTPTPVWLWLLLVIHGFIWPHIAYQLSIRSPHPYQAEMRNLQADSFLGGCWIALIGFNALPSAIIVSMMGMNNIAAGGRSLLYKCLALQLVGCGAMLLLGGRPVNFDTTPQQIYICLPMLMVYPIFLGHVTYRTARHLAEHKQRLLTISIHDGLTGVYNRQHWEHQLHNAFDSCKRYQHTASLILIDIDHFKQINDNFGHDIGDEAIQVMTNELRIDLRAIDIIGRYGGDEFGLVLPNTSAEQALLVISRIRSKLAAIRFKQAPELVIHISAGIAEYQPQIENYQQWLKAADIALYRAKRKGRSRTEMSDTPPLRA